MKLTPERAFKLAKDLVTGETRLSTRQADFVESMVRITRSKGPITLTERQALMFEDLESKAVIGMLDTLIDPTLDAEDEDEDEG